MKKEYVEFNDKYEKYGFLIDKVVKTDPVSKRNSSTYFVTHKYLPFFFDEVNFKHNKFDADIDKFLKNIEADGFTIYALDLMKKKQQRKKLYTKKTHKMSFFISLN